MIIEIKTINGIKYYTEAAPENLQKELAWAVNDLAVNRLHYTRANIGDVLTAYYVNNSEELANFPDSGHLIYDAIWSFAENIAGDIYEIFITMKGSGEGYYCAFSNLPAFIELSSHSGETVSISSLASNYSNYLSAYEEKAVFAGGGNSTSKTTHPYLNGAMGLKVKSQSLGISIDSPLDYIFTVQR